MQVQFAPYAQIAPALPLVGGGLTRYQPVGVFDVAQAVAACLDGYTSVTPMRANLTAGDAVAWLKEQLE